MGDLIKFPPVSVPKEAVCSQPDPDDERTYALCAVAVIYLWGYYRWIDPHRERAEALLEILERQQGPEDWVAVRVPKWVHESVDLIDEEACRKVLVKALKDWART